MELLPCSTAATVSSSAGRLRGDLNRKGLEANRFHAAESRRATGRPNVI